MNVQHFSTIRTSPENTFVFYYMTELYFFICVYTGLCLWIPTGGVILVQKYINKHLYPAHNDIIVWCKPCIKCLYLYLLNKGTIYLVFTTERTEKKSLDIEKNKERERKKKYSGFHRLYPGVLITIFSTL